MAVNLTVSDILNNLYDNIRFRTLMRNPIKSNVAATEMMRNQISHDSLTKNYFQLTCIDGK